MSNKHKGLPHVGSIGSALEVAQADKAKQQAHLAQLVPSLESRAEEEAEHHQQAMQWRVQHLAAVLREHADDAPGLQKYPDMVRKAFAKKQGFNMSLTRAKWTETERKMYDTFCANIVSPTATIIILAIGDGRKNGFEGIGVDKTVAFLEGQGTFPKKVAEARVLIGKPATARGKKGSHEGTIEAAKEQIASVETTLKTASGNPIDVNKMAPIEATITLITSKLPLADCIVALQAISNRLIKSDDMNQKILGEVCRDALNVYYKVDDGEDDKAEVAEGMKKQA